MSNLTLRPYQREQFSAVKAAFKTYKRVLISSPTGSGKTILFLFIAHSAMVRGSRVLVLVNTDELVRQTVEKFLQVGVRCGVVKCEFNEWDEQIVVASIQTISRPGRLEQIPRDYFRLVVVDECHLANSASYQRVLSYFDGAWMLGVSATLFRGDKQSLAKAGWQYVAHVYSIEEAIADGYLVAPVAFRIELDDNLDDVQFTENEAGELDFNEKELERKINTITRNSTIVDTWLEKGDNRRTVFFCVTVEHTFDLANAFRQRAVDARVVHGAMNLQDRRRTLEDHRAGIFPIVCNCAVLTHGYDDPGVACVGLARPTRSKTLAVQCIGRGLRPDVGKVDCIVLDFVSISSKHKLVTTDDVIKLQREMKFGVENPAVLRAGRLIQEPLAGSREFSNEAEAEEWRSRQVDLLNKKEMARQLRLAESATEDQKKWLFDKLTQQLKWPEASAKEAVFGPAGSDLTRGSVVKFFARAKYGAEAPGKYTPRGGG